MLCNLVYYCLPSRLQGAFERGELPRVAPRTGD